MTKAPIAVKNADGWSRKGPEFCLPRRRSIFRFNFRRTAFGDGGAGAQVRSILPGRADAPATGVELLAATPRIISSAAKILESEYGVAGDIRVLPGEYDFNFEVSAAAGRFVLKVMRADCEASFIDMQVAAMERAREKGLGASIPTVIRTLSGEAISRLADARGNERLGWLISFLPGKVLAEIEPWTPPLAASIGALLARLDLALRGFEHSLLARKQKWNLLQADWIAEHLSAHPAGARRRRIEEILSRFQKEILPRLQKRPLSAIYNDANDLNIFVGRGRDGALRATGIIDFGDMVSAPRVCDPAIAMAYMMMGPGDPIARGAALAGAFHKQAPLEEADIHLLAPLVSMRLAVSVTNAAIQRALNPGNVYLQVSEAPAWRLLDYLERAGDELLEAEIRRACEMDDPSSITTTKQSLLTRRRRIAPDNQALFYADPLRLVRGERHFLYDGEGVEYLDVYNNVPHVGHAHPRVVSAATAQMARLNTNTRYLQDIHVDYAERMISKLPQPLSRIIFLNSASEANELALRLARAATGARDMIVMDHCYHGNTTGAMDISPYKFNHPRTMSAQPAWVHVAPQPDIYRGARRGKGAAAGYVEDFARTLSAATEGGRKIAGFISECAPSVGGQIFLPEGYLAAAYALVRAAGGVCIADDVQTSLGRLGAHFWGFDYQVVVPDVVVLGKPIGNGFPLAAVAMTDEIAAAFSAGPEFFSTFGGSSASCAAGAAVLDVLLEEELQESAARVGERLIAGLHELSKRHALIGDIRGTGLFLGVDLVFDQISRAAAAAAAAFIKNRLRERRILLGTEGPDDNVLKIRPPMTFDAAAAERLLSELDDALAAAPI